MLYRQFPRSQAFPNRREVGRNNGVYPFPEGLSEISQRRRKRARLLVGHYPFQTGSAFFGSEPFECLTFLRDPLERAISNLGHIGRNSKTLAGAEPEYIFSQTQRALQNAQVRYLSGAAHLPSDEDLIVAKAHLEDCTFVGLTERFSESLWMANHTYGWSLGQGEHANTSPHVALVSDELRQRIAEANRLDMALYEHAQELFQQRLAAASSS